MAKRRPGRGSSKPRAKRPTQAAAADRYRLYQESVQDPPADVQMLRRVFRRHFDRTPRLLREDFCGTAALACQWVVGHPENRAWGVDLDPEPLAWGREHNLAQLSPKRAERLTLIQGNVLDVRHRRVDITCAYNFSYFIFQTRATLLRYLRAAHAGLRSEGILMLDAYGGGDAQVTMTENREQDGFEYVWDQDRFDPINHNAVNHIHFEFPDGSRLEKAFSYDWRLWTLPELRDLLVEAGFSKVEVLWEGTDRATNEGNGIYRPATSAPDDPAWVSYIAAVRRPGRRRSRD